jgi:hypothetical protein
MGRRVNAQLMHDPRLEDGASRQAYDDEWTDDD